MELKDLQGKHTLDAVDFLTEKIKDWCESLVDAESCRFRLDGVVYAAIEDPSDGYRSHMRDLFVDDAASMTNVFPPVKWSASTVQNRMTPMIFWRLSTKKPGKQS